MRLAAGVSALLVCPQNEYMKDDFFIKIETWHKPDLGTMENVSARKPVCGCARFALRSPHSRAWWSGRLQSAGSQTLRAPRLPAT